MFQYPQIKIWAKIGTTMFQYPHIAHYYSGLQPLFRRHIFEKNTGRGQIDHPPPPPSWSLLRVKSFRNL